MNIKTVIISVAVLLTISLTFGCTDKEQAPVVVEVNMNATLEVPTEKPKELVTETVDTWIENGDYITVSDGSYETLDKLTDNEVDLLINEAVHESKKDIKSVKIILLEYSGITVKDTLGRRRMVSVYIATEEQLEQYSSNPDAEMYLKLERVIDPIAEFVAPKDARIVIYNPKPGSSSYTGYDILVEYRIVLEVEHYV